MRRDDAAECERRTGHDYRPSKVLVGRTLALSTSAALNASLVKALLEGRR